MRYSFFLRQTALLTLAAGSLHVGLTSAQEREAPVAGTRPAMSALTAPPATAAFEASSGAAADGDAQGHVAELIQMIHDAKLVELRTTYNGSYGATLFFYPQEMTYYVGLFQNRYFWRVIKLQDEARAEAIYAGFVQQTAQLAEVEIRRTQLEAQNASLNRGLALSADRARRLKADLDVARAQQAQVDDRQRQMQAEATALRAEKLQAQAQLRELQRQVETLQRQNEAGLPGAK